jgi:hypothetical protein
LTFKIFAKLMIAVLHYVNNVLFPSCFSLSPDAPVTVLAWYPAWHGDLQVDGWSSAKMILTATEPS